MAKNKTLELSIKIAGKMDKSLTAALASSQGQLGSFAKSISNIGTAGLCDKLAKAVMHNKFLLCG